MHVIIVQQFREYRKLAIYEAFTILDRKTGLQIDNFVNPLKLFARGYQLNPARFMLLVTQQKVSSKVRVDIFCDIERHEFIYFIPL